MINVIADRYAQALFEVGEETQTTSELYQELSELVDIFNENKDLYNFLKSPLIGREDKKNVMQNIFKNQLSNSMNNFLKLVIDKDRISAIENMKESYKSLLSIDRTNFRCGFHPHPYRSPVLQRLLKQDLFSLFMIKRKSWF